MKQKLGLASPWCARRSFCCWIEPTVGVDPLFAPRVVEIVRQLVEIAKTDVLLSTAYLDEASDVAM